MRGDGRYSFDIRLKAIEVSLINSLPNIWFGNGAGLSQKLLPKMANDYDRTIDVNSLKWAKMLKLGIIGEPVQNNKTVIDSHNLFITELFNIGIIGSSSLLLMVC